MNKLAGFLLFFAIACIGVKAQNTYEETFPYTIIDGKIILQVKVSGKDYKFLFDTWGKPAVLADFANEMGIEKNDLKPLYSRQGVEVVSTGIIERLNIGKNIFKDKVGVFVIKNDYLKSLGVAGVISGELLRNYVITIDSRDKTITATTPYKPTYIQVRNRIDMNKTINGINLTIGENSFPVIVDLYGDYFLSISDSDYKKNSSEIKELNKSKLSIPVNTYEALEVQGVDAMLSKMTFVKKEFVNQPVFINPTAKVSSIGSKILNYGILSIDYFKLVTYFQPFETLTGVEKTSSMKVVTENKGNMITLNRETFTKEIFNYKDEKEWRYLGNKPAIIDFWAEWCGPCKKLTPILEELAYEYKGKVIIYKVNVDNEPEIAKYFKASVLPMLMMIPINDKPFKSNGLETKEQLKRNIEEQLLNK